MKMETTVNIQVALLNKITREAKARKISRSRMIISLLEMMMDKPSQPLRFGRLVKYQDKKKPEEWHTFHLSLMENEYEYFQDMRKLLKMSLSLLISCAVTFLDDPDGTIITDNYLFTSYLVVKEIVDSIICWRLYWGHPVSIMQAIKELNR